MGLRPVFAGQLGDGKTLVLFQNREGQFFASVVPLFNQAQLQSQMNSGAGQVSAQTGNGSSGQAAQIANGGSSSRQTEGATTAHASTGAQSAGADQETSSTGEEERSAGATQQTGVNDQSRRSSGSSGREEDTSTVSEGSGAQGDRGSGDSGSSHASDTASGTSTPASASGQTAGRPAASSYMGVTDAPADDTASTSSGDGESTSVAQNDSADTGSSDSSGGESSVSESSSRGSDSTSSGSHASGSTSGSSASGSSASGSSASGSSASGSGTSDSGTSDSAGHADSSSGTGGASRPLYTPTTSPSFGSGNTSGDDATDAGQGGETSSGSSDEADGQDGGSTSGSSAGSDDSGSSSGSSSSEGGSSTDGELPAGTTSNILDKVESAMNESGDKFEQTLGDLHDNYDQYSKPDAAGDSVCATPDAMIKHQTESQGYLANVNPSWTWSHAGHANSALGGWDHWPADERGHLTEVKDVPGKWNRLMPWFVISRVSGSHVAADIEVRNMAVYWFPKKDKQWHLLAANLQPDAAICTPDDVNMSRCKSTFSGKATTGTQNAIHGWFTHVEVPDGAQAISVAVEARLVKGGPALMTVAGDYYPPDTVSLGGKFVPGAAASAPQRLKDNGEWTVVTMTTLTDQTKDDTGISRDMLMKRSPQCKNPARYYRP